MADVVERLREACVDWDGLLLADQAEPRSTVTCGELREAVREIESLRARLSQAGAGGGVVVQKLAWNEYQTDGEIDRWDAETVAGTFYEIGLQFDGYHLSHDHLSQSLRPFDSPDEAKAFAQADYSARILAALAPSPSAGEPVAWQWRHCGEQGWRLSWDKPFNPGIELKPLYTTPPATPVQPTASAEAGTPSARWKAEGKPDPHGDRFNIERSKLIGGNLTDDEVAHQTAMLSRSDLNFEAVLATARDRIRWLSRRLDASLTPAPTQGDGGDRG